MTNVYDEIDTDDVAGTREHTPGAKAHIFFVMERAKAKALAYLEAKALAYPEAKALAYPEAKALAY